MTNTQAALIAAATFCTDHFRTEDGEPSYNTSGVLEVAGEWAEALDAWDMSEAAAWHAARKGRGEPMTPTVLAPVTGRLVVRLPFQPRGGNYRLLREVCGQRTRPTYDRQQRAFLVARDHLDRLLVALDREFGAVELTRHGSTRTICVAACLLAQGSDCTCSCAGEHHGANVPPAGARLVATSVVGEVFVIPGGQVTRTVRLTAVATLAGAR